MGLIDLKTDLKSLKYSKDRIGGGSSNQPFVQKSIPDSFSAVGNTGGLDVLTRGGSLIFQSVADDASRLTKLLLTPSTFQGPAFTIKQNVLSRQNVQTQASPKGLNQGAYLPTSTIAQAIVNAEGLHFNTFGKNPIPDSIGSLTTYSDVVTSRQSEFSNRLVKFTNTFVDSRTLGNTLYSYPGGPGSILGLGQTRINIPDEQRTGINNNKANYKYLEKYVILKDATLLLGASDKAFAGDEVNAITGLNPVTDSFSILSGVSYVQELPTADSIRVYKTNLGIGTKNAVNLTVNSNYATLSNLTGSLYIPVTGSASNSGKVPTDFRRVSQPTTTADKDNVDNLENLTAFTYDQNQLQQSVSYRQTAEIQDFRQRLRNINNADAKAVGANVLAPSYTDQNIEKRVHLGNPGLKGDISDYSKGKKDITTGNRLGALDKINALTLYQSANVAQDSEKDVNDLVKFRIAVMDSNGSNTKTFIHFRAFLNNITDNYTSDWQSFKYVGRGENFYTYNGFDRKVSLSWTVYAQSREELIPMYKKLNYLASSLAPDYNNGFMRGVLVQLTIGGYFYNQPGFITGLTYDLTEESTWEIGINDKGFSDPANRGDDLVKELPHMIKVSSFNFTPIHRFIPEVQKNTAGAFVTTTGLGDGPQRYIALDSGYDNNYDS